MTFDDIDAAALGGRSTLQVVVDRVQVGGEDTRQRLTDSIETAYREGGGAAWAIESPVTASAAQDAGSAQATHRFSERFECRECGIAYEDPQPRLFSFNNPFGACPTCHGFGNIIELDMDLVVPDPSKSIAQNAIEPWSKPHYRTAAGRAEASRAQAQDPPRRAMDGADRGREAIRRRRRRTVERRRLRGDPRLLPLARAKEIQGPRPRVPQPVPRISHVPGLRRRAAAARGARRARRRADDRSGVVADGSGGAARSSRRWS